MIGRIQFAESNISSLIGPSAYARKPRKLETSHDRRRSRRVEKVFRSVIGREEVFAAAHTAYGVPLKSLFRFSENLFSDVSNQNHSVPLCVPSRIQKIGLAIEYISNNNHIVYPSVYPHEQKRHSATRTVHRRKRVRAHRSVP